MKVSQIPKVHAVATTTYTVYPKEYAHGFVVLCFVVVMQSFIMNSHELFIHIHQGCFAGSEVSLMDMGKSVNVSPQQSTAKQKPCAYFLGYTVYEVESIKVISWLYIPKDSTYTIGQNDGNILFLVDALTSRLN